MNLFSSNLVKLQHIRQRNQAEEIQRKIQSDLDFLKELLTRPDSQNTDRPFYSRANSVAFKDQDFAMEDYVNKYFEEIQQKNEQSDLRKTTSRKSLYRGNGSKSPENRVLDSREQNRQKLRSVSLNQEKERMRLGEIFRLQEKIEEIIDTNQEKKNKVLNRVLSESDFYAIKKINFSNYKYIKVKNPNPQQSDYLDKSTLMIDEMSSSYKYVYKLSKKFCNIDNEMTEKVQKKMKEEKKKKELQQNGQIMPISKIIGNPFAKKLRSESILNYMINNQSADPINCKEQIHKKVNDYNKKTRKELIDNSQRKKLSRVNSDYLPTTLNQTTNATSRQNSLYPQIQEKEELITTHSEFMDDQYQSARQSQKKRSLSTTKSLNPLSENPSQKHFIQKINQQSQQKLIVQPNSMVQKNQKGETNNENTISNTIRDLKQYNLFNDNAFNKKLINSKMSNKQQQDKIKKQNSSFLQTVKSIDLSQSFQFNTLVSKNEKQHPHHPIERIEKDQKLNSSSIKESPLKLYTLFQNKNLRQKISSNTNNLIFQKDADKPKYLNEAANLSKDDKNTKIIPIDQIDEQTSVLQPKNIFGLKDQECQTFEQSFSELKVIKRKIIDEKILLKIRNDHDFKTVILKIIVRENLDIKSLFERDYSATLDDSEINEGINFFTKFIMQCQSSTTTTNLFETLSNIFQYQNEKKLIKFYQQKQQHDQNDEKDIALNVVKQLIMIYPDSINKNIEEPQLKEYLSQNLQLIQQIKESLYI